MIFSYLLLFGLNLLIEETAAFLGGFGKPKVLFAIVLVNLVTHPLLTFSANQLLTTYPAFSLLILLVIESLVVLIEAFLLHKLAKEPLRAMFVLSLGMNLASLGVGLLL